MSGTKLLLDTNVVLHLLSGDQTVAELINDKQVYLSFITELKLLGYRDIAEGEQNDSRAFFFNHSPPYSLNILLLPYSLQIGQLPGS